MSALFDACMIGKFPTLDTMVDYGLDGRDGVNPVDLFERYRTAVLHGAATADDLYRAMTTDTLSELVGIKVSSGYYKKNEMARGDGDAWVDTGRE